jgi:hypothetical protein
VLLYSICILSFIVYAYDLAKKKRICANLFVLFVYICIAVVGSVGIQLIDLTLQHFSDYYVLTKTGHAIVVYYVLTKTGHVHAIVYYVLTKTGHAIVYYVLTKTGHTIVYYVLTKKGHAIVYYVLTKTGHAIVKMLKTNHHCNIQIQTYRLNGCIV